MGLTPFPNGVSSFGIPVMPGLGAAGIAPERLYFVRAQGSGYFKGAHGTLQGAITHASDHAIKRPVFVLLDDIREEVTIPNTLADGTIIGAGTRPRHGDSGTNPFGPDTASWRNSSGVTTTALCLIRAQGWRFVNLLMDAPTTAACVELNRTADSGAAEIDASHAQFFGCRFASGETGIEVIGSENLFNVRVEGCTFQDLTDGIKGLNAYRWEVVGNKFQKCTNCIDVPAVESLIDGNQMVYAPTKGFDLTGGSRNTVTRNVMVGDYNVINVAGTNDSWGGNYVNDESAGLSTTVPSGS